MNNQPYGRRFDEVEEMRTAAREAAQRIGQKEVTAKERSRQILNYYTHGRAGRVWNN